MNESVIDRVMPLSQCGPMPERPYCRMPFDLGDGTFLRPSQYEFVLPENRPVELLYTSEARGPSPEMRGMSRRMALLLIAQTVRGELAS